MIRINALRDDESCESLGIGAIFEPDLLEGLGHGIKHFFT
jgi:hypothetical protein